MYNNAHWSRDIKGQGDMASYALDQYYGYGVTDIKKEGTEELGGISATKYLVTYEPDKGGFSKTPQAVTTDENGNETTKDLTTWEEIYIDPNFTDEMKTTYADLYEKCKEKLSVNEVFTDTVWVNEKKQVVQIQRDETFGVYTSILFAPEAFEEEIAALRAQGCPDIYNIQTYQYDDEVENIALPTEYVDLEIE